MKLQNKITVTVTTANKEIITFILRRPTNQEINEFQAKRFDIKKEDIKGRLELLEDYFDSLLMSVENLEDETGIVTVDRKDAIPANWKQDIIAKLELDAQIDIKN